MSNLSRSRTYYDGLGSIPIGIPNQTGPVELVDISCHIESTGYRRVPDNESQPRFGLGSTKLKMPRIPDSQAHDKASRRARILAQISEILCSGRLVNPINVNLLFIAAGNAPVVWERLLPHDCMIKHRFVSGVKPREREIDGRCQSELYSIRQD